MLPSNAYGRKYPVAIACFTDDLDELLAIHRGPMRHRPLACAQVPTGWGRWVPSRWGSIY
jgi:hypothetical protein